MARHMDLSKLVSDRKNDGSECRLNVRRCDDSFTGFVNGAPRIIISSLQFSDEDSGGWFGKSDASNTKIFSLVLYFVMNKDGESAMREDIPPARLFKVSKSYLSWKWFKAFLSAFAGRKWI